MSASRVNPLRGSGDNWPCMERGGYCASLSSHLISSLLALSLFFCLLFSRRRRLNWPCDRTRTFSARLSRPLGIRLAPPHLKFTNFFSSCHVRLLPSHSFIYWLLVVGVDVVGCCLGSSLSLFASLRIPDDHDV
jgi:hypothetical protein